MTTAGTIDGFIAALERDLALARSEVEHHERMARHHLSMAENAQWSADEIENTLLDMMLMRDEQQVQTDIAQRQEQEPNEGTDG